LSLAVGDAADVDALDVDALDADVPVGGGHAHEAAGVGAGGERHDRERWPELNVPRSLPGRLTADVRAAHLRLACRPRVGLALPDARRVASAGKGRTAGGLGAAPGAVAVLGWRKRTWP
jgi:hypothetical protein